MIGHIRLVYETVFLCFVTNLSVEHFFDKMSKGFDTRLMRSTTLCQPVTHYAQ